MAVPVSKVLLQPVLKPVLLQPVLKPVVLSIGGGRGKPGPQGDPAAMDVGFEYEGFGAGVTLNGLAIAHDVDATSAGCLAITLTPPTMIPQVLTLYDMDTLIGICTFSVNTALGVVALVGGGHTLARGAFPRFLTPNPLDSNFSQFAFTFAGP